MPVADYKMYCRMIDHALQKKFAYPAINVTSLTTANSALKGLADSKSDGIIQEGLNNLKGKRSSDNVG